MSDAVAASEAAPPAEAPPAPAGPAIEPPRRLHPATVALNAIRGAPGFVFGIPAFLAIARDFPLWSAGLAALGLALVVALFQFLAWRRFTYQLTEDAVVIESGIFARNRRTIPFDRVQDVDIERKLLARLFGLAKVSLETGGAGEDEGALDSVSMAEAERLREVVRRRAAIAHAAPTDAVPTGDDQPVPATPAATGSVTLFAMSLRRVLVSGLFRFSLVWLAVIGTLFQYFDDFLPWDWDDATRLRELGARADAAAGAAEALWLTMAIVALLFAVALLGVLAGLVSTLLREYGFTLTDEGGRYRRVRGLLTRTEAVIALKRVQLALIENGVVMRLLGWSDAKLQTLGGKSDGGGGRHDVAPFARAAEIDRVLAPIAFHRADPDTLVRVSTMHVWRMLITRIGWLLFPIVALTIARSNLAEAATFLAGLLLLFALLAIPIAIVALLQRGRHRYGLAGDTLHVQRGVMTQRSWIVPVRNVQAVSVRRTWLQRRLGTATVMPDTAGAALLTTPTIEDVRPEQAWTLVAQLRAGRAAPAQPPAD